MTTLVRIVKAMVYPDIMHTYENWILKKYERYVASNYGLGKLMMYYGLEELATLRCIKRTGCPFVIMISKQKFMYFRVVMQADNGSNPAQQYSLSLKETEE